MNYLVYKQTYIKSQRYLPFTLFLTDIVSTGQPDSPAAYASGSSIPHGGSDEEYLGRPKEVSKLNYEPVAPSKGEYDPKRWSHICTS